LPRRRWFIGDFKTSIGDAHRRGRLSLETLPRLSGGWEIHSHLTGRSGGTNLPRRSILATPSPELLLMMKMNFSC
jgi:hypothetical protein